MNDWKTINLVKTGLSHNNNGTNCQDNVCVAENDLFLVAALADGLGSLEHSEQASLAATQSVCDYFIKLEAPFSDISEEIIKSFSKGIINDVKKSIQAKADEQGLSISDMDCTLSFVCVSKVDNHAVVGILGDSAVCIIGEKESRVITEGNESANGTYAVLDNNAADQMKFMLMFMTVFIAFASFSLPTAIALYWIVTYAFIVIQTFVMDLIAKKKKNKKVTPKKKEIKDKLKVKEGMKYGKNK